MPDVPYFLTREFCKEHGRKGASKLALEFTEGGVAAWKHRRLRMHRAFPKLVPLLDNAGRPIGALSLEPETADEVVPAAEFGINGDERTSLQYLPLTREQLDSPDALLEAHGFNAEEWQLVSASNKVWNMASKRTITTYWCGACNKAADGPTCECGGVTIKSVVSDGHDVSTLYASAIKVKPRNEGFDIEKVMAAARDIKPVQVRGITLGAGLLELQHCDMHLGNSTFETHLSALERTVRFIRARKWDRIVVTIGSDLFHCDNFKNTTSNGTLVSSVDWPAAYADAMRFYSTIIEEALKHSAEVFAYYIVGNHDESMSWMFCHTLSAKYPQIAFDLAIEERKVHRWGDVAIGMTHGDNRNRKDLDRIFMAESPEFASATIREVHAGHFHHEVSVNQYGVVTRSLSTKARTDKWHREQGFVGTNKRFMLFEYEPGVLTDVHYV